ncbi:putative acetyltransferase [Microbispora maris]|uniref:putative acetyltransferase n=1 Tax=Microbispora maris TaxID=3144104 RepID=UPI003D154AB0
MVAPRLGARFVIAVTPADVGKRVTTRRTVPGGYRDAVGVLESWHDGVLIVRKRDGSLVEIAEDTLAAAKVVPPAPPAR